MKLASDATFFGSNNFAYWPIICLDSYNLESFQNKSNCLQFGAKFGESAGEITTMAKEDLGNPFKSVVYPLADFKVFSRNFDGEGIGFIFDMDDIDEDKRMSVGTGDATPVIIKLRSISYVYHAWVSSSAETGSDNSDDGMSLNTGDDSGITYTSSIRSNRCTSTGDAIECISFNFRKQTRWVLCSQPIETSQQIFKIDVCTECGGSASS